MEGWYHCEMPDLETATHPPKTVTLDHLPQLATAWTCQVCVQRAQVVGLVAVPCFMSPYTSLKSLLQLLISSSPERVHF